MNISHLFIPHHSNNNRAKILHAPSMILIVGAFVLFQSILSIMSYRPISILGYASQISPQEVIKLTNEKRVQAGLSPLKENQLLSQAALQKGQNMLEKDYWAHTGPDGTQPWAFFSKVGYKYRYAGENLARDFTNPKDAVEAWMASNSHRDNLMSAKYQEIGIAVVEGDLGGSDTTLIVQLFGTRVDTSAIVPVAAAQSQKVAKPDSSPQTEVALETPAPLALGQQVLIQSSSKTAVSPFDITKVSSILILGIFLAVFIIDSLIVAKRRIPRVGGRVFAHISILGMALAVVLIAKAGSIL